MTRAGSQANRYSIELAEAVRALVRATEPEPAIPASELLVVLGHLHTAGYGLAQALQQLTTCLRRSTEHGLYWAAGEDVDPAEVAATHLSVAAAVKSLSAASERAEQCGTLVGRAQREIVQEARAVEARLDRRMLAGTAKPAQDEAAEESSYEGFADREWLTAEEAAEVAGVSVSTIKNALWRRVYGNGLVGHRTARAAG